MVTTLRMMFLGMFAFFMTLELSAGMLVTGRVAVGHLYVRAKADKKYTKVATLRKDDTVVILGQKGKWYKILAPSDTETWLPSSAISGNTTNGSTYIYSGPSIGYTTLGTLAKGALIKVIDKTNKGWTKIATPQGTTAWVYSDFISVPKATAPKLAAQKIKVTSTPEPVTAKDSAIISPKDKKAIKARKTTAKHTRGQARAKPTGKVAKASKATKPVGKVGKASKSTKPVGKVGKASKATKPVGKVAKASKATKPVGKVAKASKTKPIGKTAKKAPLKVAAVTPKTSTVAAPKKAANVDALGFDEDDDVPGLDSIDSNVELSYIPGSIKRVRRSGYILPLINPIYVTNALGAKRGKNVIPFCFLHCKGFNFETLQNSRAKIMVYGLQKKVKGWKLPMIEVEKVYSGNKLIYRVPKTKVINLQ